MSYKDTPEKFGSVTRVLHWSIGFLIIWQMLGMLSKVTLGREHALTESLAAPHQRLGSMLFMLIVIRLIWAMINCKRRPAYGPGLLGKMARTGHISLYAVMFIVPALALLRSWGAERAFAPFGPTIFAARAPGEEVKWATELGHLLHGELGWLLALLIVGHVGMALWHQFKLKDDTIRRILP